jgi:hypothetical protein
VWVFQPRQEPFIALQEVGLFHVSSGAALAEEVRRLWPLTPVTVRPILVYSLSSATRSTGAAAGLLPRDQLRLLCS